MSEYTEDPVPPCRPDCERCAKALRVLGPVGYNNWRSFGEHDEPEAEAGSIARPSGWEQAARDALHRAVNAPGHDAVVDLDRPAPERIVRAEILAPIYEPLAALSDAVLERTGRHGVTRISLTPEVGLAFGIAPGTSVDVNTPAGRVEVYAERTSRAEGVFTLEMQTGGQVLRAFAAPDLGSRLDEAGAPRTHFVRDSVPLCYEDEAKRLTHELAKADRRAAEQERIIAAQREQLEAYREARHRVPHPDDVAKLRAALSEALEAWESWAETKVTATAHLERIAELRKLTEGP